MDHKLDRYLDQQDRDYVTATAYLESDNEIQTTPQDERTYLTWEIRGIEKILAIDDKYSLVTPAEWNDRLLECRLRLGRLLEQERKTLQGVIDLHCEGLIKCNTRILELEAEMAEMEVSNVA
jgi:hypothetical protein